MEFRTKVEGKNGTYVAKDCVPYEQESFPLWELEGRSFQHVLALPQKAGILFEGEDGVFALFHVDNCCEEVYLEDLNGDLGDLENSEILSSEESTSEKWADSLCHVTWTFYHLRTMKGTVSFRFYGSSNGYYSERVELFEMEPFPTSCLPEEEKKEEKKEDLPF